MSKRSIRIRFSSFNDAAHQPFLNTLLYIRKFNRVSNSLEPPISMEEKDPESVIILADTQAYDSPADDEYLYILFITSISQTKPIADLLLWRNFLVDFVNDPKHNKDTQSELLCNIPVKEDYILQLSLRMLEEPPPSLINGSFSLPIPISNGRHDKLTTHSIIQGHLMKRKQFNRPVHCAICNKFIWGIHQQGYECSQCFLVTHKKCHKHIPFWCRQSQHSEDCYLVENRVFEIHIPHIFKHHEAPIVRAFVAGDHGHCNHCGSQVVRHGLKCTQCHFIVHEHCAKNVPPMCTVTYSSVRDAVRNNFIGFGKPSDGSNTTPDEMVSIEKVNSNCSNTSSHDLTWISPLPKEESMPLPKFSDFQYIGRLGHGGYGNVYCVQHIQSKKFVAIKVADGLNQSARQQLETEKQILCRYSEGNPYMIKAYCAFHHGTKLFLAMELVDGDTLNLKILKNRMNEDEVRIYLAEIISVLQYLHSNNIIYRDLKLEHVIVCSDGPIRLVDYGLGKLLKTSDQVCHTICGTPGYTAPEILRLELDASLDGYSYAVDFWAVGIILLQMLCGEQVDYQPKISLDKNDEVDDLSDLAQHLNLFVHISPEARACITGLLEIDPRKRLGSPNSPHGSIRDHPFFKGRGKIIHWEDIDDGLFKCIHTKPPIIRTLSDDSINTPLPTLLLDRRACFKAEWIDAGESTCTSAKEEEFKSFDYINRSTWLELDESALF